MESMTGYGRGEATGAGVAVTVELRSVNNRFRDLNLRTPREYAALEPRVVSALKAAFARGRIDVYVRRTAAGGGQEVVVNEPLARAWVEALRRVLAGLDGVDRTLSASLLANLPGVVGMVEADPDVAREWPILEAALDAAIAHLAEMRRKEGEALRRDLAAHLAEFDELLQKLRLEVDGLAARLQNRLIERINRLVGDRVDPARLAQEAAVQADKADISEEMARLASHLAQFRRALDARGPVGRRLEFLVQEMNREVNTIGSKAVEHAVSALVVDMKTVLERLREQAANVQ